MSVLNKCYPCLKKQRTYRPLPKTQALHLGPAQKDAKSKYLEASLPLHLLASSHISIHKLSSEPQTVVMFCSFFVLEIDVESTRHINIFSP